MPEKIEEYDKNRLPSLLVDVFELVLLLSDQEDEEMEKVHNILFLLFKKLISELDLNTIIIMNRQLVQSKRLNFNMNTNNTKPERNRTNSRMLSVSLSCFQEIIFILKTRLTASSNDERVLLIFGGIVEFILREMYGSSQTITEKIYQLLEEILIIRSDMEEMVCESLFSCIKSNYNQMTEQKTKEFLQLVLNKINPRVFINILVKYVDTKLFSQHEKVSIRLMVLSDLLDYITVILGFIDHKEYIVEDLLFGDSFSEHAFKLWSLCPVALIKAGLLCKRFDFSYMVLESELEENSGMNGNLLQYMRYTEEMLQIVDSFKFMQIINTIKSPRIRSKLVRLIAALVVVSQNSQRWSSLLKKIKINYCHDLEDFEMDEETKRYEEENMRLFEMYNRIKFKLPSLSRVFVRTFS